MNETAGKILLNEGLPLINVSETAPKPFMIGEQGPEEFPGTGFGAAQPQIDRMAAEGFEIAPAVQTAPDVIRDFRVLVAEVFAEVFAEYGRSPATENFSFADALLGALGDAGWVDPEEAARLRSVEHELRAVIEVLAPVLDAARALLRFLRTVNATTPSDDLGRQLMMFSVAVDALDSGSGTEPT